MSTNLERTFGLEQDASLDALRAPLPVPLGELVVGRLRRALDVSLCLALGVVTLPIFILVAALTKLTSRGPVIHKQTRCGIDGQPFTFYKIRSMVLTAEAEKERLRHLNQAEGPIFKMYDDPRVTRLGRALRRTSIDELPQLLNVLQGHMNLVGPRPPLPGEVARYAPHQRRRLSVRPGITGLWQVSGRSTLGFEKCVELDLRYIDNWSFGLDLKIIARTIPAVLCRRGAW